MQEHHSYYITKSVKKLYCRRLIAPALYLIFAVLMWISPQVESSASPVKLSGLPDMEHRYRQESPYVSATLENLKFTGYTKKRFHRTIGYFYYTISPDKEECDIVLLSPSTCGQGIPELKQAEIYGKILPSDASYETLLKSLAKDLSWTDSGIRSKANSCYLSEPDFRYGPGVFLLFVLAASSAFALISTMFCILFILYPYLAPPCRALKHFGNPKELLALAEEELATLPQLATEDMFITEHFFIELSRYGTAIVPIREIIWIYKHSTLHKLFWYHFNISYTLHIVTRNHVHIHCPKNIRSNINGIMDYLAEANHDILIGFCEENKQKAHAVQKKTFRSGS
ncbi:MAG: hypothetical protein HFJ05_06460 [Eubacterium sp.]|nr:hypothetical protein [Eubacterium sp.]